jgi:hypothetical protein
MDQRASFISFCLSALHSLHRRTQRVDGFPVRLWVRCDDVSSRLFCVIFMRSNKFSALARFWRSDAVVASRYPHAVALLVSVKPHALRLTGRPSDPTANKRVLGPFTGLGYHSSINLVKLSRCDRI